MKLAHHDTKADRDRVWHDLHQHGMSTAVIADAYDVHTSTVRRAIQAYSDPGWIQVFASEG